ITGSTATAGDDVLLDATATTDAQSTAVLPGPVSSTSKDSKNVVRDTVAATIVNASTVTATDQVHLAATDDVAIQVIAVGINLFSDGGFLGTASGKANASADIASTITEAIDASTVTAGVTGVDLTATGCPNVSTID